MKITIRPNTSDNKCDICLDVDRIVKKKFLCLTLATSQSNIVQYNTTHEQSNDDHKNCSNDNTDDNKEIIKINSEFTKDNLIEDYNQIDNNQMDNEQINEQINNHQLVKTNINQEIDQKFDQKIDILKHYKHDYYQPSKHR